jgi:very-short-patch-repair endonuclease
MRREPTDAERKLWFMLRDRRFGSEKFRRQILIGKYIVDFVCLKRKLIIEADGGQHTESSYDVVRDRWLADEGHRVIRYNNNEILANSAGVLEDLVGHLR